MSSRRRSPITCPVCGGQLRHRQIRPLGAVTADLGWELHAGECPQHGWFQAEVISRPPREIFPVSQPGGIVRAFTVGGKKQYCFPTVYSRQDPLETPDPYDPAFWAVDWERLPSGTVAF